MFNGNNKKEINNQKGFSLVEIIVSFALFTVIMTVSLGALIVILDANAKAKSLNLVINNLSLSLESMSRELRVGSLYCDDIYEPSTPLDDACDTSGVVPSDRIIFRPADADATQPASYSYDSIGKRIQRDRGDGSGLQNLTGSDININSLEFYIRGTRGGDLIQPSVLIRVQGDTEILGIKTEFNIQTMVSQRKLAP